MIFRALDKLLYNNLESFKIVWIAEYCSDFSSILLSIGNTCNIEFMNTLQFLKRENKAGKFFFGAPGIQVELF